ncbi:MAG: hypothetical protein KA419_01455 [Acidobacteria bacterium]|nr:hypothetical protein [Acidobacteriota bacterium]
MKNGERRRSVFRVLGFLLAVLAAAAAPVAQDDRPRRANRVPPPLSSSVDRVYRGLVILAEFPDVPNRFERDVVVQRFNRGLNGYVQEMSYQKAGIQADVTETWVRLPEPVASYRISSRNLEVDRSRVRKLIDDALAAVEKRTDFKPYDFTVVLLGATLADYGMIGLCGWPGMLGWTADASLKTPGGQEVRGGVAIFCFQAHLGTFFHDVAHILGGVKNGKRGVPCLYDHDLQAKPGPQREVFEAALVNLGFWDPLSCHYIERQTPPPGICSWTRLRLGWLDPAKVRQVRPGETAEVLLGPLEDGSSETLAVRIPLSATTSYLVENRQPIGFDRHLPGSGVLVLYADDTVAECRHGKAPVRLVDADPKTPQLKGAAFDLGKRDTFEDPEHALKIRLAGKEGRSYRLLISPLK